MGKKFISADWLSENHFILEKAIPDGKMHISPYDNEVPAADVRPTQEVSDAVDEALRILNALQSSGRLDYGDYCELFDDIAAICGADMREATP